MNQIRVMLVDDEKLVIEDLVSLYDWEENGFRIVATAVNGKQAINMFRELSPEVVITDIRMPFMDGIELTRNIRKIDSTAKILLLTAYSDFEYAKKAIEFGITDYMLKGEINRTTIAEKLLHVRQTIESEHKTFCILSQKLIGDLFNPAGSFNPESYLSNPGISRLLTTPFRYIIIEEDMPLPISGINLDEIDGHSTAEILSCCMSENPEGPEIVSAGIIRRNQILLIFSPGSNTPEAPEQPSLRDWAETLKQKTEEHFHRSFSFYLVPRACTLTEMEKKYSLHYKHLFAKYILGTGGIFSLGDRKLDWTEKDIPLDEDLLNRIVEEIDFASLFEYIDNLFEQIFPPAMNYDGLMSISRFLYSKLHEYTESLPSSARTPDLHPSRNRMYWMDGRSIRDWLKEKYTDLLSEKQKQLECKYSSAVLKIIEFIHENYSDKDLSIDRIADHIGLSANRLSVLYKQQTGSTLNRLITDVRIEKAKEMLEEGYLKIYEISDLVGYGSSQYFSQIFYKITGLSPKEYQKESTH